MTFAARMAVQLQTRFPKRLPVFLIAVLGAMFMAGLLCTAQTADKEKISGAKKNMPSPPETVRVTVDAGKPQWPISKFLTGMHFVYGYERDSLYQDERIADWMRRAKVGIIRWPGGTAVQTYHRDQLNGISFGADTWDSKSKAAPAPPADYMDLDEYIAYCRRVGAEPMVGVNLGSGRKLNRLQDSLDEARRLIKYCKDKHYHVRHWYIGNECFIGWNAEKYAEYIDLYAGVLKSVDPDIVIVGDWKFGPDRQHRFTQLLLIAKKSKQIDVIETHEKWGTEWGMCEEAGEPTLENWQQESGLYSGRLDNFTKKFFDEMKAAGKNVRLGFNEWGAEMPGKTSPFHVALVKADYLITLFRHPVYSACDWNLNMGPPKSKILVTANDGHTLTSFNPAAKIFELCASALEQTSVPLKSSDRFVYGFAAKDAQTGGVQVYLLNKYSTAASVQLDLAGLIRKGAQCRVESFVEPGVVKQTNTPNLVETEPMVVRLEPLSFNRLTITPAAK